MLDTSTSDQLRRFPIFADLSAPELEDIASELESRSAGEDQVVLGRGRHGAGCGFILAGQASVRVGGEERTRLGPGDVFGEISTLLDEPAAADVVALGPLHYAVLPAARFKDVLTRQPTVTFRLLQAEVRRLRSPERWFAGTSGAPRRDGWSPASWQRYPAHQQPEWPDPAALETTLATLRAKPPLVFAGEARHLTAALADVAAGRAFLLQAGDCAESFVDFSADAVRDKLKVMLQMAAVLTYGAGVPIVKVGRIAGQFAKPRSSPTELVDGEELPSFRGYMVNDDAPSAAARRPDPRRMVDGYQQSMETLNLLRAFTSGGFASLTNVHVWNQEFVAASHQGKRYQAIADAIHRSLQFMGACGFDLEREDNLRRVDYWTSHEALLLPYEEALTRRDSLTGDWYDCSAHMLWIGERTRQADSAHVEFLSGVANPIGCKVGPKATPDDVVSICERLNPERVPGRLTLITRMGAGTIRSVLGPLVAAVRDGGHPVVWACDPMHGNTSVTAGGRKTRHFDRILEEIEGFFAVCTQEAAWPGGIHVELTGDDVTECLGGGDEIVEADLDLRYTTACDPRLNANQSLDMAFRMAELLQDLPRRPTAPLVAV
ncbi:MAG: class II 3-deoxy-7-phosphoheptulonate synthase [Acidimicrobiales bacterium]